MESRLREKFSELKPGAAVPPKIVDVIGALMSEKGAFNFCDTTTTSGIDYRRGIHYNSHYAHRRGRQNCSPCLCFLPHPSQNGVFLSFVKSFEIRGVCIFSRPDASARFALKALAFPPLVWYSISAFRVLAGGGYMAAATAKIRCETLPCAGAVRSCRLFSPAGSPGRAAALCRLLSADQSDLYRAGHGVGIFHIAPNPAPKLTGGGCCWAARWPCCGCFCARSSIAFSADDTITRHLWYLLLCAADPCAAFQPVCRAAARAAGGRRDFSQSGICCSFLLRC